MSKDEDSFEWQTAAPNKAGLWWKQNLNCVPHRIQPVDIVVVIDGVAYDDTFQPVIHNENTQWAGPQIN